MMRNTLVVLLIGILGVSYAHSDIFKTRARMDVSWHSLTASEPLTAKELFQLEDTIGRFLHEQLRHLVDNDKLALSTVLQVKEQTVGLDADQKQGYSIESIVEFYYIGHTEIDDMAFLLAKASMDGLQGILQKDIDKIDPDVDTFLVAFSFLEEDTTMLHEIPVNTVYDYSRANRGLVLACSVLVTVLIFVSCVLLYVSGSLQFLKSFVKRYSGCYTWLIDCYAGAYSSFGSNEVRKSPTDSTDDSHPDVVLGANAAEDEGVENLPPGFSPKGRVYSYQDEESEYGSEMMSPVSQATDLSSRILPLGIMSARKLNHAQSPKPRPENAHIPKYNFHQEQHTYT